MMEGPAASGPWTWLRRKRADSEREDARRLAVGLASVVAGQPTEVAANFRSRLAWGVLPVVPSVELPSVQVYRLR